MSAQHAGTPGLAHHFNTLEQQQESQTLGMWLFLVTEVMFFGGMFATYGVYRYLYGDGFVMASRQLDVQMGGWNTALLLCSSLAMALAVYSSMHRNRSLTGLFLMLTLVLGCGFLVIKGIEYKHKFEHHLVPGHGFQIHDPNYHEVIEKHPEIMKRAELFFGMYFTMTGVHAFHMVVGVCVLSLLIWRSVWWDDGPTFMSVELTGLYWHFVDVVWVFLFPLLYLIDRSPK